MSFIIFCLINFDRHLYGLSPLRENYLLDRAAQSHAQDMVNRHYFAHNSPDGRTPWDFIVKEGYGYQTAGENLARNFTDLNKEEKAWMNSPGHRANILNPKFKEIGISVKDNLTVTMFAEK